MDEVRVVEPGEPGGAGEYEDLHGGWMLLKRKEGKAGLADLGEIDGLSLTEARQEGSTRLAGKTDEPSACLLLFSVSATASASRFLFFGLCFPLSSSLSLSASGFNMNPRRAAAGGREKPDM